MAECIYFMLLQKAMEGNAEGKRHSKHPEVSATDDAPAVKEVWVFAI